MRSQVFVLETDIFMLHVCQNRGINGKCGTGTRADRHTYTQLFTKHTSFAKLPRPTHTNMNKVQSHTSPTHIHVAGDTGPRARPLSVLTVLGHPPPLDRFRGFLLHSNEPITHPRHTHTHTHTLSPLLPRPHSTQHAPCPPLQSLRPWPRRGRRRQPWPEQPSRPLS